MLDGLQICQHLNLCFILIHPAPYTKGKGRPFFPKVLALSALMRFYQLLRVSGASEEIVPIFVWECWVLPERVQDWEDIEHGVFMGLQKDQPQRRGEFPEPVSCGI